MKQRVVTAKNFFEYHDIDISPRKFKLKIKLPKTVRKNKEALSKEDVTDILNACSDIRLKSYIMLLASTGMRGLEAHDGQGCNGFTGCIAECRSYPEYGRIEDDE